MVTPQGIRPLDMKVKVIQDFPQPTSIKQLSDFLGLLNFYRQFIPKCAQLVQPFTDLLATKTGPAEHFECREQSASAFSAAKKAISDAAMLIDFVAEGQLRLITKASGVDVGAVVEQFVSGWQPFGFCSQKLKPAETKYSTFGLERPAVTLQ